MGSPGQTVTQSRSQGQLGTLANQMTSPGTLAQKLQGASLDPEGTQRLIQSMEPIALGKEADLANNPYYQSLLSSAQAQHESGLASGLNMIRSQMMKSGHNLDSVVQQGAQQTVNKSQSDFDSTMAKIAMDQYNAEKQRQQQAAGGLMTTYMTPMELQSKVASMNQQQTTERPSTWGAKFS